MKPDPKLIDSDDSKSDGARSNLGYSGSPDGNNISSTETIEMTESEPRKASFSVGGDNTEENHEVKKSSTPPQPFHATVDEKELRAANHISFVINGNEYFANLSHQKQADPWYLANDGMSSKVALEKNDSQVKTGDIEVGIKEEIDHTPHQLFVELDELVTRDHEDSPEMWEWKERARWIKFEEDVLNDSDRWGLPHVASLSFHSLINLHKALEEGLISLDMKVTSSSNMMQQIIRQLVDAGQLSPTRKQSLMNALLLRQGHQSSHPGLSKSKGHQIEPNLNKQPKSKMLSSVASSPSMAEGNTKQTKDLEAAAAGHRTGFLRKIRSFHNEPEPSRHYNLDLLKKIPDNAEVTSVLVGAINDLDKPCIALIRLSRGEMLDNFAEVPLPVRFIFICVGPENATTDYVEIGRSISTLMSNKEFNKAVYTATERQDILNAMNSFLDSSMVLPPGDFDRKTLLPIMHMANQMRQRSKQQEKDKKLSDESGGGDRKDIEGSSENGSDDYDESGQKKDDPLKRTGIPFGGLAKDVKRRYSKYWSDIKDGLNIQVLAAMIFIYFAAVSPAITFGGLLDDKTESYIGASELLLGTTICGLIYSIFAGQPLLIVGFTGPLLVFEEGIIMFAKSNDIDYLSWRLWIGVWIGILSLVHLACEASFLIRYVSRFTQEIFAFLISLIFIYETFAKLAKVFQEHPLCWNYADCLRKTGRKFSQNSLPRENPSLLVQNDSIKVGNSTQLNSSVPTEVSFDDLVHPNTALLSMTLTLFTFAMAYYFKGLRNKKVLGRTVRRALGDFGVPISIFVMCIADFLIGDDVYTQKLSVPEEFSVTSPEKRGWLINPLGLEKPLPVGHIFSAAIPALVGCILIFMETLITGTIVNKREHKLKKGTGFHLDILLMGVFGVISGVLGLPFMTCATVRSVAHTSALTVISKNHAPGEQPKLEKVIEQRLSNFVVHILIGASMFLGMVLRYIPLAVLFGVFLYMGVASLGGIQLYNRLILIITPTKHHPVDVGYIRHVRVKKMHIFTIIQVVLVAILWVVKSSPAALAFPFVLILIPPFRLFILKFIFTAQELNELDQSESSPSSPPDSTTALNLAGQDDEPDFYEQAHMPI